MKSSLLAGSAEIAQCAPPADGYLNKQQTARYFGVTVRTIDGWMARRLLPYYKIGRTVRFKAEEITAHLKGVCQMRARCTEASR